MENGVGKMENRAGKTGSMGKLNVQILHHSPSTSGLQWNGPTVSCPTSIADKIGFLDMRECRDRTWSLREWPEQASPLSRVSTVLRSSVHIFRAPTSRICHPRYRLVSHLSWTDGSLDRSHSVRANHSLTFKFHMDKRAWSKACSLVSYKDAPNHSSGNGAGHQHSRQSATSCLLPSLLQNTPARWNNVSPHVISDIDWSADVDGIAIVQSPRPSASVSPTSGSPYAHAHGHAVTHQTRLVQ